MTGLTAVHVVMHTLSLCNIYLCLWSRTCTGRSCRNQNPSRTLCLSWSPTEKRTQSLRELTNRNQLNTHTAATPTGTRFCGFVHLAAGEGNISKPLSNIAQQLIYLFPTCGSQRWRERFDWCVLPAVAPQVGCVQDFHRSEWGCTGWITPGRTPFYLRRNKAAVSDK